MFTLPTSACYQIIAFDVTQHKKKRKEKKRKEKKRKEKKRKEKKRKEKKRKEKKRKGVRYCTKRRKLSQGVLGMEQCE